MSDDQAFMVLFERHEAEVLIDALIMYREDSIKEWGSPDHRVDVMLKHVMMHAGLPYCKEVTPEAYKLVFPEGPPRVVGSYGKYTL